MFLFTTLILFIKEMLRVSLYLFGFHCSISEVIHSLLWLLLTLNFSLSTTMHYWRRYNKVLDISMFAFFLSVDIITTMFDCSNSFLAVFVLFCYCFLCLLYLQLMGKSDFTIKHKFKGIRALDMLGTNLIIIYCGLTSTTKRVLNICSALLYFCV